MKILSVNVGKPQPLMINGRPVIESGIVKRPVEGAVMVRRTNLDGDQQADLSVHGGIGKAVYAYPSEYYPLWREELKMDLSFGNFGENLTTEGILDSDVCAEDRWQMGSAVLLVTQPRMPCFKLAARFDREDVLERMISTGRHGFYFAVVQEGEVCAGDEIRLLERKEKPVSIPEMVSIYLGRNLEPELVQRAMKLELLSPKWKAKLAQRAGIA